MGAELHDPAVVDDCDLVGAGDGREPVGDRDGRAPGRQRVERLLHGLLRARVERARGLVEHEHGRVAQHDPRDREALPLAAREAIAALADERLVAVRQTADQLVDLGGAGGCAQLLVGRVRPREAQVLGHGRVQEVRLLRHHADQLRAGLGAQVAQVVAVDEHAARRRVVQPCDEVAERRLAGSGRADDGQGRSRRHRQVDAGERLAAALVVREADVLQAHVATDVRGIDDVGGGRLDEVDGRVEVLEHAREQRERALHLDAEAQQGDHRHEQARLQRGEGDERADGDEPGALRVGVAGDPVDERRHRGECELHRRHPPAARHRGADLEVGDVARRLPEVAAQIRAAAHRPAEHDPADRERLLDHRRHVGEALLPLGRDPAPLVADRPREPHEERDHHQRREGQPPVEGEHRHEGGDDGRERTDERGDGRGDHALHRADVVRDPRLHLAAARAREEGQRHPLQVVVHGGAQAVHDLLADAVAEVGLPDVDDRAEQGGADHAEHEPGQQRDVLLGQGDVDELAQQERLRESEQRRYADQRGDEGDPSPVRTEQPHDSPAVDRLVRGGGDLRVAAAHPSHSGYDGVPRVRMHLQ